jgi:RimJ/RimL family protein N-acetyltransferase
MLASLVQDFRRTGEVGIGCWLDDPLNEMIPTDFDYDGRTYYFTQRSPDIDLKSFELPAGYTVVPRDEDLFLRSFDYSSTLELFGTVENVLTHTLGTVVLHGDNLVSEAATGAPTHGRIEVGVTTAEPYRRQGLATVACARLIEICEGRGYKTWWDCAKQNTASVRLAHRLGYLNKQEYRYTWWAKSQE